MLDQAWKDGNWPVVIPIVESMYTSTPKSAALKEKLFSAHLNYAVQLVRTEKLAEAVAEFDKALAVSPGDSRAVGERKFAQLYLEGTTALNAGDFEAAITPLRTIYDGNPNYRSVKARLYGAYADYAGALEKGGKNSDAYLTFQKASNVDDKGVEAQEGMARLKAAAPSSSAAAAGKKIEVDIAKQQVTAWQGRQAGLSLQGVDRQVALPDAQGELHHPEQDAERLFQLDAVGNAVVDGYLLRRQMVRTASTPWRVSARTRSRCLMPCWVHRRRTAAS